jgi:hypothetical protein
VLRFLTGYEFIFPQVTRLSILEQCKFIVYISMLKFDSGTNPLNSTLILYRGRIFCGLCQVGAWGCFDEFNRLEERILSAVSQQVLTIQRGLIERHKSIELLGRSIKLHENVGIFVTMNPGTF